jgi:phage terminase small subunit
MTRGRKPYETRDIIPFGVERRRLRPPASLGEPEKRAFLDLVLSVPLEQFQAADLPLLARWSELTVMAETAAAELRTRGMVIDGKVSPWFSIHRDACKELRSLALRLRLGPQSRASKAPKTKPSTVSYYERMELEGQLDDEAN